MTEPSRGTPIPELDDSAQVTAEVGDEGGSPGDVEIAGDRVPGSGSEATETRRPAKEDRKVVVRDESAVGRRSP